MKSESEKVFKNLVKDRLTKIGVAIESCKKCQAQMVWIRTAKGKWAPVTLSLMNHFIDCPYAKDFKTKVAKKDKTKKNG